MSFLRDAENVEGLPAAPEEAINTIKTAIEFVDTKASESLFELVKHYQVHNARFAKDTNEDALEVSDRMYDTVYLRGLVNQLFEFARMETEDIPDGEMKRDTMLNALRSCVGLVVYVDVEHEFQPVIALIENRHPEE